MIKIPSIRPIDGIYAITRIKGPFQGCYVIRDIGLTGMSLSDPCRTAII